MNDLKNLDEILKIKELGWQYSKNYFKRIIKDKKGICLIAEHEQKIVGIIFGEFNKKENWAELTAVGVLKEYQGLRIGFNLIKEFERKVKENNIEMIELFAHKDTLARQIEKLSYKKGNITYISQKN